MKSSPRISLTVAGAFRSKLRWSGRAGLSLIPLVAMAALCIFLCGHSVYAGDNVSIVISGSTDLTKAGTYSGNGGPSLNTDVEFSPTNTYSPATFTVNSSGTVGSLNDLSATPLTITNTSGSATVLGVQLGSYGDSVPGAQLNDVIYVASGGTLNIQNGTGASTLTLNLSNQTTSNIDSNGTLNIGSNIQLGFQRSLVFLGAGTTTVSGTISGTPTNGADVYFNQSGTVNLDAVNNYVAPTVVDSGTTNVIGSINGANTVTINGGVLSLQSAGAMEELSVTLNYSGVLNETVANALSGSTSLTVSGVGSTANLSQANNFTGSTTVSSGVLNLGHSGALANTTGAVTVNGVNGVLMESAANALTGSNALTISSGSVYLSQGNNYTGATTVSGGLLQLSATNAMASSALSFAVNTSETLQLRQDGSGTFATTSISTVSGGTDSPTINVDRLDSSGGTNGVLSLGPITFNSTTNITVTGGTNGYSLALGNLVMNQSGSLIPTTASVAVLSATDSASNQTLTLAGTATGNTIGAINFNAGSTLIKTGASTWALTGSNAVGGTTINGGTLSLNFGAAGAPLVNMINGTSLTLSGGTLNLTGGSGLANSQTFSGVTLNTGASYITATQGGASSLGGTLNAITRNAGATIDFTLPTTGSFTTSTTNGATSILGGWATVSGTTWAVTGAAGTNPITGLGTYQETSVAQNVPASYSGSNVDVNSSQSPTGVITANSLRFNTASPETLTLFSTGTSVISSGGILVTSNVGTNTSTITSGTLAGASGGDLVIQQNNTAGGLAISSVIANNGASATALTKSGAGTLTLSAGNTYTGLTYLNGGVTNIAADSSLGTAPGSAVANQLTLNGGTLQFNSSFNLATTRGITLLANGGTIDTQGFTAGYGGIIAGGNTLTKIGSGQLTLSGANSFSGGFLITNGTVSGNTSNNAFGSNGNVITLGAAGNGNNITLDGETNGSNYQNPISLAAGESGALTIANNTSSLATVTFSGAIALNGNTLNVAPASTNGLSMTGIISGNGGLNINAGGGGTVLLNNQNTYSGGTTVANGSTLKFGSSSTLSGNAIVSGPIGGGTLVVGNNVSIDNSTTETVDNNVTFSGTNITFLNTNGDTYFNNQAGFVGGTGFTAAPGSTWTIGNSAYGTVFAGNISFSPVTAGGVALTVNGAGTLMFYSVNGMTVNYGGGSVVINGNLQYGSLYGAYGANGTGIVVTTASATTFEINSGGLFYVTQGGSAFASGTTQLNGGTLETQSASEAYTYNTQIVVTAPNSTLEAYAGGVTYSGLTLSATNILIANNDSSLGGSRQTIVGTTLLENNVTINLADKYSSEWFYMAGGVSDDSGTSGLARSLTITGTGGTGAVGDPVIIGGVAGTYTGNTYIANGGKLYISVNNALPNTVLSIDNSSSFHLDAAGIYYTPFNGNAFNQRILGLTGSGSVFTGDTNITQGNESGGQNATLTFDDGNAADFYTFSGIISNANTDTISLVKSGESTQILTGLNTYNGSTSITGGVLQANDGVGLSGTSLLIFSGSDGVLQGNGTFIRALGSTSGSNQVEWAASSSGGFAAKGGTLTVAIGGTGSPTALTWGTTTNFLGSSQTLDFGSSTADSLVNFENAINLGTAGSSNGTVRVTGTAPAELSGVISGVSTENLTLIGGGKLILAGANTYAGLTLIQNGTLDVSSVVVTGGASNLGNATSSIGLGTSGAQGTFEYAGSSATMTRGFNLNGNGVIAIDNAGQTLGLTGGISLNSGNLLTVSGSGNLAVSSSPITGVGTSGITMNSTGTLTLVGTNSYSGNTTINSGIVSVNALNSSTDSLGVVPINSSTVTINGGTLQYTGPATATDRYFTIGANGATLDASGSGPIDFNNTNAFVGFAGTNSTTLTLTGTNTGQNTLGIALGDPNPGVSQLSLVKNGTGTWLVTGAGPGNSNSGTTIINAGTLQVDYLDITNSIYNPQPLGESANLVLGGSSTVGTLQYIADGVASPGNTLYQNVTVGAGGGIISNASGAPMTLAGTLTKANTVLTLTSGTFDVTGQITGGTVFDFNSDLDVNGAFVNLSNSNNNYTGPTYVYNGGTIQDGLANAMPVGTVLTLGASGDGAVTNTLDLAGNNQSVAALNNAGSGTNIVTNSGGSLATLTLTGSNSDGTLVNSNFGGSIQDGSSQTALTLSAGTAALTGANSYTGPTTITSGTLQISGAGVLGAGAYAGSIANGGSLVFNSTSAQTLSGNISGAGSLTQEGASTLTLSGASTYTGPTTINSISNPSTLKLDFSAAGAPANNILSGSSALVLGGGNLIVNSASSGSNSQTLASLTLNTGVSTITMVANGSGVDSLTFTNGTITRNAGSIDFIAPAGTEIVLTGNDNNPGLGSWAFFGTGAGETYAATNQYGDVIAATLALASGGINSFVSGTTTYSYVSPGSPDALTAPRIANSAVFSVAGAQTIDLSGYTLTINSFLNFGTGALTIADSVGGGALESGSNQELVIGGTSNVIISAVIADSANGSSIFADNDSGTMTFSGSNTYTGATFVNAGMLQLATAAASGSTSSISVASGASLDLDGITQTANPGLTLNGAGVSAGAGALTNSSATGATYGGAITLASASSIGGVGNITLTNGVSGAFGLTKIDADTLTLSGTDTYTGATSVSAGTLQLGGAMALGNGTNNTSGVTVSAGGVLDLDGFTQVATPGLTLNGTGSGTGVLTNSSATAASYGGAITLGSSSSIGGTGNITLSNSIGGAFALTKVGADTLTLGGNNNYSGGTTITSGTVQTASATGLGATTGNLAINAGTLDLDGNNVTVGLLSGSSGTLITTSSNASVILTAGGSGSSTFAGVIQNGAGTVGLTMAGSGALTLTATDTYTGPTAITSGMLVIGGAGRLGSTGTYAGNISDSGVFVYNSSAAEALTGTLSGGGALIQEGPAQLALGGNNSYSGGTTITSGTLQIANASGLGATTGSLAVNGGTLDLDGNSVTVGLLTGSSGALITTSPNAAITLTAGSATSGIYGGVISNGAGTVALTYNGSGTLTLGGSSTYTGLTTVSGGTLKLGSGGYLAFTDSLTTGASGTFDLGGQNQTLALVTDNGLITNSGAGTPTLTMGNGSTGTGNTTGAMNIVFNPGATASSFTTGTFNNAGTITDSGAGAGTVTISNVGSNVTGVTENSTTSALTVSGTLNVNSTATTLTNSSGTKLLTITNTVVGTGGLVIDNNSATNSGITFTAGANNSGTITNSGNGAGTETLPAVGSNVTAVTENSAASALSVTALTVNGGGTTLTNSSSSGSQLLTVGTVAGTGNLVLNNNTLIKNGITFTGAINNTGLITNISSGGTGSSYLIQLASVGANVTGINQDTPSGQWLVLDANPSYTGTTTITSGVLVLYATNALGTGPLVIDAGGTLDDHLGSAETASAPNAEFWNGNFTIAFDSNASANSMTLGAGVITLGASSIQVTTTEYSNNVLTISGTTTSASTTTLTFNDSVGSGNVTVGGVNHIGTVVNSGAATATTILNTVGSNITGLTENSAASALSIGTLTVNSGGTTLTNSNASGSSLLTVTTGVNGTGNLILDNNSSINNGITLSAGINNTGTVTNAGTGTGSASITGLGANVTSVTENSAGPLTLGADTNFDGSITLTSGTLNINSATALGGNGLTTGTGGTLAIGAGTVINNSSGSGITISTNDAETWNGSFAFGGSNALNTGPGAVSITPASMTVTNGGASTLTVTGTATGTSNLTINDTAAGGITFTYLNNSGTVVNSGLGTGAATLTTVGSNVTGVTESATGSALTIANLIVNSGGTTLTDALVSGTSDTLNVSTGVTGNGNLVLKNNSPYGGNTTSSNGISLSAGVNNTGSITNSGTGTGSVAISGMGANVTSVTENSASSGLVLGANTNFQGSTYLSAGRLWISNATSLGGNGSTTGVGGALIITGGIIDEPYYNTLTVTTVNAEDWNGNFSFGGTYGLNIGTGAVTLGANVTVTNLSGGYYMTVPGNVGGSANLTLYDNQSGYNSTFWNFTGTVNNNGTITDTGTDTAAVGSYTYITNIGSNVTGVTESGSNMEMSITNLTVNSGSTTLALSPNDNGTGRGLTVTGNVLGTGNLTLNDYSTVANGLGLSGSVAFTGNIVLNNNSTGNISITTPNNIGTITNSGTGSGGETLSNMGANVTSVYQTSTTSSLALGTNTNFGGTVYLNSGTLFINNGSTSISLGNATLVIAAGTTLDTNWYQGIAVTSTNAETWNGNFSFGGTDHLNMGTGAITLGGNVTVTNVGGATVTIGGNVGGTGNLSLYANNAVYQPTDWAFTGTINNNGTISDGGYSSSPGYTGEITSIANVGSNVTGVTESGSNCALSITNLAVNSGGTTLTLVQSGGSFNDAIVISGSVTGTGNLVLDNNSTVANGINISGTINNTAVINSGTGSGSEILAGLGAPQLTSVTQNSTRSTLELNSNTNYQGSIYLNAGTLSLLTPTSLGGNGSSTGAGGALNIAAGTTLSNGYYASLALTTVNAENWNGNFTVLSTGGVFNLGTGAITLGTNVQLTADISGYNALIIGGNIGGTGNLSFLEGANVGGEGFAFNGTVNNSGTVVDSGTSTNGMYDVIANVGSNVTAVADSGTGVTLDVTNISVNSGGTTLTVGSGDGSRGFNISGLINGTGNLIINNNSSNNSASNSGLYISGTVNNAGVVTNSGLGIGSETIPVIGSNVTGVTESSTGSALTVTALSLNSGGTTLTNSNPSGSQLLTISNAITGSGNLTLDNNSSIANGITLSAAPNNTGTITNAGTGSGGESIGLAIGSNVTGVVQNSTTSELTLTGANIFAGSIAIQSGTLSVNSITTGAAAQPLGEGTSLTLGVASTSTGILQLTGAGTLSKNVTALGNGTILNSSGGLVTLSGTLTKSNTVLTLSGGTFSVTGPVISAGGAFNSDFDVNNGATVTLSNANNDYYGPTVVSGSSTLQDGIANALPASTILTLGAAGDAGTAVNTYNLNGYSQSVAGLSSAGNGTQITTTSVSSTPTLTISGTTSTESYGGSIRNGSGTVALTVTGGTQVLSGASNYTGATNVLGGTLVVSGSLSGTGAVNLNSSTLEVDGLVNNSVAISGTGSTVQGTGSIGALTLTSASNLAPGFTTSGVVASGALTVAGNVTFSDTASTLSIGIGIATGSDATSVASSGIVTLDNTPLLLTLGTAINNPSNIGLAYIILNGGAGATGSGTDLFSYNGVALANDSSFTTPSGFTFEVIYRGSNVGTNVIGNANDDELVLTAIPEPGTWAMMLSGAAMLIGLQRMRRRRL